MQMGHFMYMVCVYCFKRKAPNTCNTNREIIYDKSHQSTAIVNNTPNKHVNLLQRVDIVNNIHSLLFFSSIKLSKVLGPYDFMEF